MQNEERKMYLQLNKGIEVGGESTQLVLTFDPRHFSEPQGLLLPQLVAPLHILGRLLGHLLFSVRQLQSFDKRQ